MHNANYLLEMCPLCIKIYTKTKHYFLKDVGIKCRRKHSIGMSSWFYSELFSSIYRHSRFWTAHFIALRMHNQSISIPEIRRHFKRWNSKHSPSFDHIHQRRFFTCETFADFGERVRCLLPSSTLGVLSASISDTLPFPRGKKYYFVLMLQCRQ